MRCFLSLILVLAAVPVQAADARQGALRLMSYNLNFANPSFGASLDAIAAGNADVVLLQEVTERWRDALLERFRAIYPHRAFQIHTRMAGGLAVLSKLPIAHEELWDPPAGTGAWFPAQRIVVTAPFGALQLLNVHLRPARDRGSWLRGFMTTREVRRKEIEAHWRKLDRDAPTIVAGDFNEDPSGRAVAFLEQNGMARVATAGPATWHYQTTARGLAIDLLKMDIDHVMIDRRISASDGRVLDAGTSDHRPVVVTIAPR
jgi:endonuclease/exonuclease/phosphatase (EEP) superfamily protein YafD